MKKLFAFAVLPLFFALVACGGQSSDSSNTQLTSKSSQFQPFDKLPPSFDGHWVTVNPTDDGNFEATISNDHIEILFAGTADDDTTALYWDGTFPTSSDKIVSQGNVKKMSNALLASQDKTKTFVYKDGELSFPFSMMGVSSTIHLKKNS